MALIWVRDGNGMYRATATEGNDTVTSATDGNVLTNNNFLELLGGHDLADMGFGWDAVFAGAGNDTVYGGWGEDTLFGDEGNDLLYGGDDDDHLIGGSGADALYGELGNDLLDAGENDGEWDNLAGGDGHDIYVIHDSRDVITAEASFGSATSRDRIELKATAYDMNATADSRAIEDLTVTGQFSANVNGNMLANTLIGGEGYDTITGDFGNDTIDGGKGDDKLSGGLGDDLLQDSSGHDTLWGNNGSDTLFGGIGSDALYGGNQGDTLYGGMASDQLHGDDGNDVLYGDMAGESGNDYLMGDAGNDTLYGGSLHDTLQGGAGNDKLIGDAGDDLMQGGAGDDTYWLRDAGDKAFEAASEGYDLVYTTLATTNLGNYGDMEAGIYQGAAVAITMEGTGAANILAADTAASAYIRGYYGNDTIYGSGGNDRIDGGGDNDMLSGRAGNDTLDGSLGSDTLQGGAGNDFYNNASTLDTIIEEANGGYDIALVEGASYVLGANIEEGRMASSYMAALSGNGGDNTLIGNDWSGYYLHGLDGNDKLFGGKGSEQLHGGNGNDTLTGSAGNDVLLGGNGADLMQGGAGNDSYYVDNTLDKVVESIFGNGIDTVLSSLSAYTLAEDVENLTFIGGGAFTGTGSGIANEIRGGSSADVLNGMGGNDKLFGNGGADKLWGGSGSDEFHFSSSKTISGARIHDFAAGSDTLVLDAAGGWSASWVDADTTRFTSNSGDTVLVDGFGIGHAWDDVLLV